MKKFMVAMLALMMLVAFAGAAFAAESPSSRVIINGRMLTDFGWWNKSKEMTANQKDDVTTSFVNVPGHSYLRARWRTSDAMSGGMVELGLKSLQPDASVSLRYAYGWYKVGNCRILAGQTDNWFGSLQYHPKQYVGLNNNSHLLLFGWGLMWPHRVPQVQFTYSTDAWGLQFAIEEPRAKTSEAGIDFYTTIPRLTLTAMFKAGGFQTHPGVLWVNHEYELGNQSSEDDSYATWAFVLPMKFTAGAFTAKLQAHYGVNIATEIPFYPANTGPIWVNGKVYDTQTMGGFVSLEYQIGAVTLVGGFGYENIQNDDWKNKLGYKDDSYTRTAYFVAVPYQINKYFGIHPEFSYFDYGDNPETSKEQGNEWMLGIQFRFIF
ncbi:hypothetical protein AAU61_00245 [Desulfocarbo indianensis]|nr:hypothetical protein AAU61_00245 [Desulfocarbo indianensis]